MKQKKTISKMSREELVHELTVHQVELEMQNEELRGAQLILEKSRDNYSDLYDFAPVGYCTVGGRGLILEANLTLASILGVDRNKLVNMKFTKFIAAEDIETVNECMGNSRVQGGRHECTLRLIRHDGPLFYARLDCIVHGDNPNEPVIHIAVTDITERKKAEEALSQAARSWQYTFDAIKDYILIVDVEHKILNINEAGMKALNLATGDIIGKKCYHLLHHSDSPPEFCPCLKSMEHKKTEVSEYEENGRNYELTAWPIIDENKKINGFTHIVRDITRQKNAEKEQAKLQLQLLQSQKMQAIGTLAGGIAHDFNNKLTTILGNAQLILKNVDNTSEVYHEVNEIYSAGKSAAALTQQMLLYSRKQPMGMSALNLNDLISNHSNMLKRLIGEDISLKLELDPGISPVNANESNLEQVITNLCVNARDALQNRQENKIVTIKTENVSLSVEQSKPIDDARPGNYACLCIEDNGYGMDDDTKNRIFEPFFTTKGIGRGTGLGLSVVYGILKEHNGWINIDSSPFGRTVCRIYLPAEESAAAKGEPKAEHKNLKGGGENILVIEDEESVLSFTEKLLTGSGYCVYTAESSEEAVEVFRKNAESINLIISDMILPDRTGLETVKCLNLIKKGVPVIFSSGYLDENSRYTEIQKKGYKFIQKPFEADELLKLIKETLEK